MHKDDRETMVLWCDDDDDDDDEVNDVVSASTA